MIYLISYLILYSSFPSSVLSFPTPLPFLYNPLIQSIRVGSSLCLFIFSSDQSSNPRIIGVTCWCYTIIKSYTILFLKYPPHPFIPNLLFFYSS